MGNENDVSIDFLAISLPLTVRFWCSEKLGCSAQLIQSEMLLNSFYTKIFSPKNFSFVQNWIFTQKFWTKNLGCKNFIFLKTKQLFWPWSNSILSILFLLLLFVFTFAYLCSPLFTFVYLCSNDASVHKFCACSKIYLICILSLLPAW